MIYIKIEVVFSFVRLFVRLLARRHSKRGEEKKTKKKLNKYSRNMSTKDSYVRTIGTSYTHMRAAACCWHVSQEKHDTYQIEVETALLLPFQ